MEVTKAPLPYPIGQIDADGLDEVEALVADAAAVEGVGNVHEGGSYYAERIIRRAIEQGTLSLAMKAKEEPADEHGPQCSDYHRACRQCLDEFDAWKRGGKAKETVLAGEVERIADALGCFWNAAIGEAHNRQSPVAMDVASVMAEGINAIAVRLRETAALASMGDDGLTWLANNKNLELSWGELGDDLSEAGWRVHSCNGGINDREWKLVAVGETPQEAIALARTSLEQVKDEGGERG